MMRSSTPSPQPDKPGRQPISEARGNRLAVSSHWARVLVSLGVIGLSSALVFPLGGCVMKGTHDEVVAQRDALANDKTRLETRVRQMSASVESLDSERARLLDELEVRLLDHPHRAGLQPPLAIHTCCHLAFSS